MRAVQQVLDWYVYSSDSKWRSSFHTDQCAFSVAERGRGIGFYQCSFKPKVTIEGYGFCKKHAAIINKSLVEGENTDC